MLLSNLHQEIKVTLKVLCKTHCEKMHTVGGKWHKANQCVTSQVLTLNSSLHPDVGSAGVKLLTERRLSGEQEIRWQDSRPEEILSPLQEQHNQPHLGSSPGPRGCSEGYFGHRNSLIVRGLRVCGYLRNLLCKREDHYESQREDEAYRRAVEMHIKHCS
ncbi:hypothetical protein H920_15854 [Fukomys damarensis]|uniref:Uncharacterized protein n=1 Tax=Fukomys damarensis TaxID=885580 RepID=A0A091DJ26_FUKDA|nr:hypothetical protein H920_15854 [Fukomys damarensis]